MSAHLPKVWWGKREMEILESRLVFELEKLGVPSSADILPLNKRLRI